MLDCIVLYKVETISPDHSEVLCTEGKRITAAQEERVLAEIRDLVPQLQALRCPIRAVNFDSLYVGRTVHHNKQQLAIECDHIPRRPATARELPKSMALSQSTVKVRAPDKLGRGAVKIIDVKGPPDVGEVEFPLMEC